MYYISLILTTFCNYRLCPLNYTDITYLLQSYVSPFLNTLSSWTSSNWQKPGTPAAK